MFLSFIVPVYNTEEYLDECLQSMLQQDLPWDEYEIICINDGSTDGSLEILRRYEREYENIMVIDQTNGGVCRARNAGLTAARGECIWYVDSDDFILENCLGELKNILEQNRSDRLVIGNYLYPDDGDRNQDMRQNTSWHDSVVWRSLFRREFLIERNLLFHYPELSFGEDALYMYEVKRQLPDTHTLDKPIYYHRERAGSLSTEESPEVQVKRLRWCIMEAKIMKAYYERRDGILTEQTANRFMSFLWGALYRMSLLPCDEARLYLEELKKAGLYPYKRPAECTLIRCPEVKRDDLVGKVFDVLYTNLSSRWGYAGMRLVHGVFQLKEKIKGRS